MMFPYVFNLKSNFRTTSIIKYLHYLFNNKTNVRRLVKIAQIVKTESRGTI